MYRIYYEQIEKKTGRVIGKGVSVKNYKTPGIAKRYMGQFEVENVHFIQKVTEIRKTQYNVYFRQDGTEVVRSFDSLNDALNFTEEVENGRIEIV